MAAIPVGRTHRGDCRRLGVYAEHDPQFKKAFEAGKPIQVEGLKAASKLSPAEEQRVLAVFEECGTDYLRSVFEALGKSVSYDQLHLWRLIYLVTRTA